MQQGSDKNVGIGWYEKVRSYGPDAGIAFQNRNGVKDWEWYSEGETAYLAYDGVEKLKLYSNGDVGIKGKLFVNGNVGIICMWSGDVEHIPKGWELCGGQSSAILTIPDLRSRFIVGAGKRDEAYDQVNAKGEASELDTELAGAHNHEIPSNKYCLTPGCGTYRSIAPNTKEAVNHSHKVIVKNGDPSILRPKWYALCFIIYTGKDT